MKIDPAGTARAPIVRRESQTAKSGFAPISTGETAAAGLKAVGFLTGVEGLFALQEVADPLERRRRALRHGHAMLDRLEALRLGLLTGDVSAADLGALRQAASEARETTEDPQLDDLLGQIDVRVAVELAKRGL